MSTFRLVRVVAGAALVALLSVSWARAEEAAEAADAEAAAAAAPPADEKGPPLPFHTLEGYGGGAITPMAYLINPGPECCPFGKPAVGMTYINAGQKNLDALTLTETFYQRVEFGIGIDRLGLGTLPMAIRDATVSGANPTGIDIQHSDVWLYNFNLRFLLVKEDDYKLGDDFGNPAITAGVQFKVNDGIESISNHLGPTLPSIGYARSNGEDFTLTATKTFPKLLGRPLILTAGLRVSEAADIGFLGFGDTYRATFEENVVFLPTDRLLVAYEFRQNRDPYGTVPDGKGGFLIGPEDNWQTFDASLILSKHATLVAGWGLLGNLANAKANDTWFMQLKYEF